MPTNAASRSQVLIAAFLFSTGGVAIKVSTLDALEIAGTRSAVAALVLWALLPSWRRFWRPGALAVGACYAATMVGFVQATKFTTAANAIFLQSTAPIYVLLLAPRLLGEPNRPSDYGVTAMLMLGMACFFIGVEPATATATNPALGNAIAVLAGLALACGLMGLRWLGRHPTSSDEDASGGAVLAGNVLAAAACLPVALPGIAPQTSDVLIIAYLGAVQIGFAYWLLMRSIRVIPAIEVSLLLLAEPVLNTLLAWGLLGERPGAWALAGCAVILAATVLRVVLQRG
jgi:drug/metabolite transporter (DMT)-like permease